jgi:cephalosporin hydroxylase
MSLAKIEKNLELLTDKNTAHSYLETYEDLLNVKMDTAKNVLEVGVCYGGSIELWKKYFKNATIWAVDILTEQRMPEKLKDDERIKLISGDAYSPFLFSALFRGKKFDFIIDDGPHTLESQLKFLSMYSLLLEEDGILIIEDVQNIDYLDILFQNTPDNLKPYIKTFDLRDNKKRYDDIVFCIDRVQR